MLEKPAIDEKEIGAYLDAQYGLIVDQVTFLPLGADPSVAVYRVRANGGQHFFLKLRNGKIDQTSVALPRFLKDRGIEVVIAPLKSLNGALWGRIGPFYFACYPSVKFSDCRHGAWF